MPDNGETKGLYTPNATMSPTEWLCIQMGSAGSQSKVSYIVGTGGKGGGGVGKVARQSPKKTHTTFGEK